MFAQGQPTNQTTKTTPEGGEKGKNEKKTIKEKRKETTCVSNPKKRRSTVANFMTATIAHNYHCPSKALVWLHDMC